MPNVPIREQRQIATIFTNVYNLETPIGDTLKAFENFTEKVRNRLGGNEEQQVEQSDGSGSQDAEQKLDMDNLPIAVVPKSRRKREPHRKRIKPLPGEAQSKAKRQRPKKKVLQRSKGQSVLATLPQELERVEKPDWMWEKVFLNNIKVGCNATIPCRGCQEPLPVRVYDQGKVNKPRKRNYKMSVQLLIHCIQDCEAYQKLNLVETCSSCGCKFLNYRSLKLHKNNSQVCRN